MRPYPAPKGRKNMPHSFAYLLVHVIFSTKNRAPVLVSFQEGFLTFLKKHVMEIDAGAAIDFGLD
jgi:hypothetical protein